MTTVTRVGDLGVGEVSTSAPKDEANWTASLEKSFNRKDGDTGQGFLSGLSALFSENVVVKKGALDKALAEVTRDASSPESLAKYQAALSEYTLYRNAQSNAVKAYKDVDANTIRNFN